MKKILKLAIAAAVVFMASGFDASAQKFGYLSQDVLIQSMPEMDSVRTKFEKFNKELQDTYDVMTTEFNKKLEEFYAPGADSMSDAVKQVKEQEMQALQDRIRQYQENAPQNQQAEWGKLMQPVVEKATAAIQKVSKAEGFTAVFDIATLLYFDPANMTDVTPLVQKELGITPQPAQAAQ